MNNRLNKMIGCGSITDGKFKLEVSILNFDDEEYLNLNLNKSDKIEIIGIMQSSGKNIYNNYIKSIIYEYVFFFRINFFYKYKFFSNFNFFKFYNLKFFL